MQTIHKHLQKTTVYISTVLHSKFTTAFWDKEDELNALMKDFATKNDYVKALALEGLIFKDGKLMGNGGNAYPTDHGHYKLKCRKNTCDPRHFSLLHFRLRKPVCKRHRKSIHRIRRADAYACSYKSQINCHFSFSLTKK